MRDEYNQKIFCDIFKELIKNSINKIKNLSEIKSQSCVLELKIANSSFKETVNLLSWLSFLLVSQKVSVLVWWFGVDHDIGLRNGSCEYSSWNANPNRLKFQTVHKVCENSVWLTNFHSVNLRGPIKIGSVFCSLQPRLLFVFRWTWQILPWIFKSWKIWTSDS